MTGRLQPAVTLLVVLLWMTSMAACDYRGSNPITVRNETDQTLIVYRVIGPGADPVPEGTERELTTLRPGTEYRDRGECEEAEMVVRTEDGTEFARRTEPLCRDDGPWVLTNP